MSEPVAASAGRRPGWWAATVIDAGGRARDDSATCWRRRREAPLPRGVRMEMLVADRRAGPRRSPQPRPEALICALGTTWRKAGQRGGVPRGRSRPRAGASAGRQRRRQQLHASSSVGRRRRRQRQLLPAGQGRDRRALAKLGFAPARHLPRPACCAARAARSGGWPSGLAMLASPLDRQSAPGTLPPLPLDSRRTTVASGDPRVRQEKAGWALRPRERLRLRRRRPGDNARRNDS